MNAEERSTALLGSFDGTVSIVGVIYALLIHRSSDAAIAIAGLGGGISATVSMATGIFEAAEGRWHRRLRDAGVMGVAVLLGSLVPIWPWFPWFGFSRTLALVIGAGGCLLVATWIGHEKGNGAADYVGAFAALFGAIGLTLLVVGLIPASAI
jgi:hypothetical protein